MARITVEDCLNHVDNRFELVRIASIRAHALANGADPLLDPENDKPTVIALREIAEDLVNADIVQQEPEVDLMDALVEELAAHDEERIAAGIQENDGSEAAAGESSQNGATPES